MILLKSIFSSGLGAFPLKTKLFKGHFNKSARRVCLVNGEPVGTCPWSVSLCMVPSVVPSHHNHLYSIAYGPMALMSTQISHQSVSRALELVTRGPVRPQESRPLVVMMAWISAERKHLDKYCELYLRRGYDVLTVRITPWQLLWPLTGSQLVADEVLQFLDGNRARQPVLLHGFSIGGYVWGEVMFKMSQQKDRYQHIIDRIVGQTWDSAADITDMPEGMPLAIFPRNTVLRMALSKYIKYHMKAYHDQATVHYLNSSKMFYNNLVRSPALMLCSKTDPIGSMTSNLRVKEAWQALGMQVTWNCWDESNHVSHFIQHRAEYIELLNRFLDSLNKSEKDNTSCVNNISLTEKLQAKL